MRGRHAGETCGGDVRGRKCAHAGCQLAACAPTLHTPPLRVLPVVQVARLTWQDGPARDAAMLKLRAAYDLPELHVALRCPKLCPGADLMLLLLLTATMRSLAPQQEEQPHGVGGLPTPTVRAPSVA